MIFVDEHILIERYMKDVFIAIGLWSQDFVDYLERNNIIEYVI